MHSTDGTNSPHNDLVIDFVGGAVGHRFRSEQSKKQALLKAAGFAKSIIPHVVDATAGLGRDAFLMASMGAYVTLIERSPHIHAALQDAMSRAAAEGGAYAETIARMTLLQGNSIDLLPTLAPETILVDPMHPPRGNTALVKKEMRILRDIVGTDDDQTELMKTALACAQKRVVLKWPVHAAPMAGIRAPSHQIIGKNTRYDVFMTVHRPKI